MKRISYLLKFLQETDETRRPLRRLWLAAALTGLGCCVGGLSLLLTADAYQKLNALAILYSYLTKPILLGLNFLPPVLLLWGIYFLTRRGWAAFLGSFLPTILVTLVNYFKIRLRSDPLLATDLWLAAEAGNIVESYTLDLTPMIGLAAVCFLAGLGFSILCLPKCGRGWQNRLFGLLSCIALGAVAAVSLYGSETLYSEGTANERFINPWSDVEVFVSKGCVYSFLYSIGDIFPTPPEGYDQQEAEALLQQFSDEDIPEGEKVSVLGIMLEAFCDLTDFDALADIEAVAEVYAPWHELEEQSVSGELLTNIFAGGTVDSEWSFLTGATEYDPFRSDTDSYVWYFQKQGYQTLFSHPGYGWFYNRQNVAGYLGFQESWFTENHYGELVEPEEAMYHSDEILTGELLSQLKTALADGPCFSFAVSYQNHGPYKTETPADVEVLTGQNSTLSQESRNLLNHYLSGVSETIAAVTWLTQELEELEEPVVLVLFGDHKPWAGNGNTTYQELGVSFDLSSTQGFYNYYSTPYVIWANSAAKETLGKDFTGEGGDFSPCFLMTELFDQCGWTGPGFLQLSRQVREMTPLVHTRGIYWVDGSLTDTLFPEQEEFLRRFRYAQYARAHSFSK